MAASCSDGVVAGTQLLRSSRDVDASSGYGLRGAGSGQKPVAAPLAAALGFALIGKDEIKETLQDTLSPDGPLELAESRRLGGAAMELLWTCGRLIEAGGSRPAGNRPADRDPTCSEA
jgi:hypothetical protein